MHVHQQQSQTCKTGKPPALREVKHPHRDRTSVSRPPSTEQGVLSQFSGYSEEIEHFTRDPCKSHLKSCIQSTKHAAKKQEVNTCSNCEHSYRMEHTEHFPAPMEMCMDNHLTQTTERIKQQHLQDKTYEQNCLTHNILPDSNFSHAKFPPGMENTPSFLGKQFLQGKEKITRSDMETCQPYYGTSPYKVMRKLWIHVHLYQEALLRASTPCSAYPHTQGEFHRTSNNWRRKVPT